MSHDRIEEIYASRAVLGLARELALDRAIYSRREDWVEDCLAMIAGRVVTPAASWP